MPVTRLVGFDVRSGRLIFLIMVKTRSAVRKETTAARHHALLAAKFGCFKRSRDADVCRVATKPYAQAALLIAQPVPHPSWCGAWRSLMLDLAQQAYAVFEQASKQRYWRCSPRCPPFAAIHHVCTVGRKPEADFIQDQLKLTALAVPGVRTGVWVYAETLVDSASSARQGFLVANDTLCARLRKLKCAFVLTRAEAEAAATLSAAQRVVRVRSLHGSASFRKECTNMLLYLAKLVYILTMPSSSAAMREKVMGSSRRMLDQVTLPHLGLEPQVPLTLAAGAAQVECAPFATRHALAQRRNHFTGADKCSIYY